jgi:imidazole glycerol-phosphate synthase subunit HisH
VNVSARVCVLDYGSGNVRSVANLLEYLRVDHEVSNSEASIKQASHLLLPGVGAFGAAMELIRSRIPLAAVESAVLEESKPFLGICVGMQVLAERGEEFGSHTGLGWIPGTVRRLRENGLPIPQVGWNEVRPGSAAALLGDHQSMDFYFVHSFVFQPANAAHVVGSTTYGETFASVVRRDNIVGVQFHPEKSQRAGMLLLGNFLRL